MAERRRQLAVIDVKPGAAMESQSGLQMLRPRIYGAYEEPDGGPKRRLAAIVMHPTSNFMGHYLIRRSPSAASACLGLNSRYAGNDTMLLMERVIQDLGAGRASSCAASATSRVVLIGNSGGAALVALLPGAGRAADRSTHLRRTATPDPARAGRPAAGRRHRAVRGARRAARGCCASGSTRRWSTSTTRSRPTRRSTCTTRHERPALRAEFLRRFRAAQQRAPRPHRGLGAGAGCAMLRATPGAPRDQAFVVHRTHADPRCLDLSLDANDRPAGSVWGGARR